MKTEPISAPLLEIKDLKARLPTRRGEIKAVDGVSLTLNHGRTLGLVGESGCGKTMLARAIMGLLPPGARTAKHTVAAFNGRNLIGMAPKQLRQIIGREIAMVFQDPMTSLNPVMPVGRQVAEVMRCHLKVNHQTAKKRTLALFDRVGIPMPEQRLTQYPHQLSGGLRQRVAIAVALSCEPRLLIADEPTTALDVTVQAGILDLLARLQEEKRMAMMLITHDLGVVAGRTHETAVMYAGKIVEQASTSTLFNHMAMPYTHALMHAMPRLSDPPHTRLRSIEGQLPDLASLPVGCRFAPRCERKQPVCSQKEPRLKPIDRGNHRLACWFPLEAQK